MAGALQGYRDALAHGNIGELTQVWPHVSRSDELPEIRQLLARNVRTVSLDDVHLERDGDEVVARFAQSVSSEGGETRVQQKQAWLRKQRSGERWYVERIVTR